MRNIDKATAKAVGDRVMTLIASAIKQEFGLDVRNAGGRFTADDMLLKFEVRKPYNELPPAHTSDTDLHVGLAAPGTLVSVRGKGYTIVKARRTKYVIADAQGKEYLIKFNSVTRRS